jgi:hypothetical protein
VWLPWWLPDDCHDSSFFPRSAPRGPQARSGARRGVCSSSSLLLLLLCLPGLACLACDPAPPRKPVTSSVSGIISSKHYVLGPRSAGLPGCTRVNPTVSDRPPDRAHVGHDPVIRSNGQLSMPVRDRSLPRGCISAAAPESTDVHRLSSRFGSSRRRLNIYLNNEALPEHRRPSGHVLCSRSGAREPWPVVAWSAQFAGPRGLWSSLPGRASRLSWRGGFPRSGRQRS